MPTNLDLAPAGRQLTTLVAGTSDAQLSARTPCAEYTVGDLLDHLVGLTMEFTNAATKSTRAVETSEDTGPGEGSAANLDPDWRNRLSSQLNELAAAWQDPAAWEGTTAAGGITLPADTTGLVALDELVVHGWDLARATKQPFACDPDSAEALFDFLSQSVDDEGSEGLFGPIVQVPSDAPLLDRVLGLTGRDPAWTP